MSVEDINLLLRVDHVKYRKAGDGRSPIGRLSIYREYVEWRDNASPEVLTVKFTHIKGQRVSPPHKSKVQLQLVLQNEEQATFVFLNPAHDKEMMSKERDSVKETLQQALIAHRAHVNQLAASEEKQSKSLELEVKQKLLRENKNLEQLYTNLVINKFISAQDFWEKYYNKDGISEDKIGINGAFLSTIAQQEGTNGVKLNLNSEIIQAIFTTYPAVEQKHLELVPHEMSEATFWTKFFQSHYFHREREVLPNPKDPFSDCVKIDEEEMGKLSAEGIERKRFDLEHLDDYALRDFLHKPDLIPKSAKGTLIKRCNYLSEKILATSWREGIPSGSEKKGFGVLDRVVEETEKRLESDDLAEKTCVDDVQVIKIDEFAVCEAKEYSVEESSRYKSAVLRYFERHDHNEILKDGDLMMDVISEKNGIKNGNCNSEQNPMPPDKWAESQSGFVLIQELHSSVQELCRHFWSCFPPTTQETEAKLVRMAETLNKFREEKIVSKNLDPRNTQHCLQMIDLALKKYEVYCQRRKK